MARKDFGECGGMVDLHAVLGRFREQAAVMAVAYAAAGSAMMDQEGVDNCRRFHTSGVAQALQTLERHPRDAPVLSSVWYALRNAMAGGLTYPIDIASLNCHIWLF